MKTQNHYFLGGIVILGTCACPQVQAQAFSGAGAFTNTGTPATPAYHWGDPNNWTGGVVPNAPDAAAVFSTGYKHRMSADGPTPAVFTAGSLSFTAGTSVFDPPFAVTDGLNLQTTAGTPAINVVAGDVFYYSNLAGTQGFEKTGAGRFTFRFNGISHGYTGTVKISGGTLGIQQDGSLGDVENDLEIAAAAKLFAEPGSNAGTITLPATRAITLTGDFAQLGANTAAVNLVVEGPIGDGGNFYAIDKTDAGEVTLAGTNTYTGGSRVTAGILRPLTPASLPFYDTELLAVNGTSTLALPFGDGGGWTDAQITALRTNPSAAFAAGAYLGLDTSANVDPAVYSTAFTGNLAKLGSGILTLDTAQPGITAVRIIGGTLELGTALDDQLATNLTINFPTTTNSPTLDLGGKSQQALVFNEVSGGTSTITNGTLRCVGANNTLSGNNGTYVDLAGLEGFSFANTELKLEVGNNVNATQNTTVFATAGDDGGTNTITATSRFLVGGGPSTATGTHRHTARFGTVNTINTDIFQLGGFNAAGTVSFADGLTAPDLKIRAGNTTAACPSVVIGETSSGARNGSGILDTTGGSIDLQAVNLRLGKHISNSNQGSPDNIITLEAGSITATTLTMAEKTNGGSPAVNAIINQFGGTVSAGSLVMCPTLNGTGTPPANLASAVQNLQADYNLAGGTLTLGSLVEGPLAVALTGGNTQRNLNWTAGTLDAAAGADLTVTGRIRVNLPISAEARNATADPGFKLSLATAASQLRVSLDSDLVQAGSFEADCDLALGATLVVTDVAAAPAPVTLGTKLVLVNYTGQALTGTFAGLADGATVEVGDNNFTIDYNDTMGGSGLFITLTALASDATPYDVWAAANGLDPEVANGQPAGDFDLDSLANMIEYVLDSDPSGGVSENLPIAQKSGSNLVFTFIRVEEAGEAGFVSEVEYSGTLTGPWSVATAGMIGEVDNGTTRTVTATIPIPGGATKLFARLKVTPPAP